MHALARPPSHAWARHYRRRRRPGLSSQAPLSSFGEHTLCSPGPQIC